MRFANRKVLKGKVEARIRASLPPGWRFIGINWKKEGKLKVADTHGRVIVIPMQKPQSI